MATKKITLNELRSLVKQIINESVTDHFVVNSKDKKLYPSKGNSRDYWQGDKKGTIDMQIDVFGSGNNKKEALLLYNALKNAGLENRYFSVEVQVKSNPQNTVYNSK